MTLIFSGFGNLIQHQFGVNEIASAIAIGKSVGSVFTRHADALIFDAFSKQYGVRFTFWPTWLEAVKLNRSGTILGNGQRQVACENTFPGVELDSVEGASTFLVLVMRYVESPQDLVKYIEDLILGKYNVVSGGDLEHPGSHDIQAPAIPYASRKLIYTFINSVIDSDATSPQHERCLQYMSELANVAGSSVALQNQAKRPSRGQYQRLLHQLFGQETSIDGQPKKVFNTLSTGAAMIGLAALANGADVRVVCQTSSGAIEIPAKHSEHHVGSAFTVNLWLTEPPSRVAEGMGVVGGMDGLQIDGDEAEMVPVYGGAAEICRFIGAQTGVDIAHDYLLALWEVGIRAGEAASWEVGKSSRYRLTDESLACAVPGEIAKFADARFSLEDRRRKVARKCSAILHAVLNYSSYEHLGSIWFKIALQQVEISYAVGCLRSIVSRGSELLNRYCWTLECSLDSKGYGKFANLTAITNILDCATRMADPGVTLQEFLWLIASIWGGSNFRYHNNAIPHERVIGIAAPHLTILANVLQTPKDLALYGLSKGIVSVHAGSIPMLPRDSLTGMVVAADPVSVGDIQALSYIEPHAYSEENNASVLFTTEPYFAQEGNLCVTLCAWQFGEVLLELDPLKVFENLLSKRGLRTRPSITLERSGVRPTFLPLHRSELLKLKNILLSSETAIVRAEGRPDWQVVAAGVSEGNMAIMACDEETLEDILNEGYDLRNVRGHVMIVCNVGFLPDGYISLLESWPGFLNSQGPNSVYVIEYNPTRRDSQDGTPIQTEQRWTMRKRGPRWTA